VLTSVQDACPDLPVDVLWALLTDQRLFTDLSASSLMQWDQVRLFRSQTEAEEARERAESLPQPIPLFTRLSFDGRLWEAEKQGNQVVLRPEVGTAFTLLTPQVQQLLDTGAAMLVEESAPSQLSEEARTLLLGAGPTALAAANQRLSTILATIDRRSPPAPQRYALCSAHRCHISKSCVHRFKQWRGVAFDRLWRYLAPPASPF
jgi:hypothetical protein